MTFLPSIDLRTALVVARFGTKLWRTTGPRGDGAQITVGLRRSSGRSRSNRCSGQEGK
jgi:hypothetical protein